MRRTAPVAPMMSNNDPAASNRANLARPAHSLSGLRRVDRTAPGGALMTIFDADGYNSATIAVPAEIVTRINRLLSVELQVIKIYGG